MSEALLTRIYDEEKLVAPAGGHLSGDVVQAPSLRPGVVQGLAPAVEGDTVTVKTTGTYDVASATGTTFTAGDTVGWDDTGKLAVTGGTGDFDIGTAAADKASGPLVVRVIFA
jgi:predicted RecA/RadA family phage recombinase